MCVIHVVKQESDWQSFSFEKNTKKTEEKKSSALYLSQSPVIFIFFFFFWRVRRKSGERNIVRDPEVRKVYSEWIMDSPKNMLNIKTMRQAKYYCICVLDQQEQVKRRINYIRRLWWKNKFPKKKKKSSTCFFTKQYQTRFVYVSNILVILLFSLFPTEYVIVSLSFFLCIDYNKILAAYVSSADLFFEITQPPKWSSLFYGAIWEEMIMLKLLSLGEKKN